VHRQEVLLGEELLNLLLELGEGRRAGVAVVGLHHRGELLVAHRVDAAVGQHVEVDVAVLEQKGVVASLAQRRESTLDGHQVELLDDPHLVHLQRHGLPGEETDSGHGLLL